uniref:Uncharacterized protein n=1 Tax=Anguilla anguilla TaxID=7936 RepID=A0A0E9VH30_ANGAN
MSTTPLFTEFSLSRVGGGGLRNKKRTHSRIEPLE